MFWGILIPEMSEGKHSNVGTVLFAALIGESFWDYPYDKGEGGLKAFIPTRQAFEIYEGCRSV